MGDISSSHMFFVHAARGRTLQSISSMSHLALSSATAALTHFGSEQEDKCGLADFKSQTSTCRAIDPHPYLSALNMDGKSKMVNFF